MCCKFFMMLINAYDADWLFNTQLKVLQACWFILDNNVKASLNIIMPYWMCSGNP